MKSYTDIEQSKKLAEILPLESADMWFANGIYLMKTSEEPKNIKGVFPCWSLAALLDVLPSVITRNGKRMFLTLEKAGAYNLYYKSPDRLDELWETKEEPIDACVSMIEDIYEQKLL